MEKRRAKIQAKLLENGSNLSSKSGLLRIPSGDDSKRALD